jgi:hypothetical protein
MDQELITALKRAHLHPPTSESKRDWNTRRTNLGVSCLMSCIVLCATTTLPSDSIERRPSTKPINKTEPVKQGQETNIENTL